jgi:hypothetical protein
VGSLDIGRVGRGRHVKLSEGRKVQRCLAMINEDFPIRVWLRPIVPVEDKVILEGVPQQV